jgi:cellobiose phosphorylase
LRIEPSVPAAWPELTIEYRYGQSRYVIVIREPGRIRPGAAEVTLDGKILESAEVKLTDDGASHSVLVTPKDEPGGGAGAAVPPAN